MKNKSDDYEAEIINSEGKVEKKKIITILLIIGVILFLLINKTNYGQADNALPQKYLDDRTNYTKAILLFNDAMDLTKPPDNSGKPFDIPKVQEQKIITDLTDGINLSRQVNNEFLDYLNPDLKNHYRNQYIKGYELILGGLKSDNSTRNSIGVKEQLEGSQLIGEWNKWWASNKDEITNKAFQNNT